MFLKDSNRDSTDEIGVCKMFLAKKNFEEAPKVLKRK